MYRTVSVMSLLAGTLLFASQNAAADNFIALSIAAEGGCGSPGWDPLSFVLAGAKIQAPFGKAPEDWSDDDLAALKTELAACQAAAAQRGNPYMLDEIKRESDGLLARIPPIVAEARRAAQARAQQVEARSQIALGEIDRATKARKQTEADAAARVTKLERDAAEAKRAQQQAEADGARQADNLEREVNRAAAEAQAAQVQLNARIASATRARDEARARTATIASLERRADFDAIAIPRARPAAPGQISELVQDDADPAPSGAPTMSFVVDTVACRTIDGLTTVGDPQLQKGRAGAPAGSSGECLRIAKGTRATVQAAAATPSLKALCVAVVGQTGCFWTARSAVEAGAR